MKKKTESSSYLEVYPDADGDAVIEVYVSPEDIEAAGTGKVTIAVPEEERALGVSEVHLSQTVPAENVRTAEHPRGRRSG